MIKFNGVEYEYRPDMSLRELAEGYYKDTPEVVFDEYVVIVNNIAINSSQAEERILQDNDSIYFVPILDGG